MKPYELNTASPGIAERFTTKLVSAMIPFSYSYGSGHHTFRLEGRQSVTTRLFNEAIRESSQGDKLADYLSIGRYRK